MDMCNLDSIAWKPAGSGNSRCESQEAANLDNRSLILLPSPPHPHSF